MCEEREIVEERVSLDNLSLRQTRDVKAQIVFIPLHLESGWTLVGLMPVRVRSVLVAPQREGPAPCGEDLVRTLASSHPSAAGLARRDCSRYSAPAARSTLTADRPIVEAGSALALRCLIALRRVSRTHATPATLPERLRQGAVFATLSSLLDVPLDQILEL